MTTIFQDFGPLWAFGLVSGALSILAYLPYIMDTFRGQTQPQRASWLIWSVLGSVALASQIAEGATDSLWFAGVQVGGTILILVLSFWCGSGPLLRRSDTRVLVAAGLGLFLWYLTETPAYALCISITVSLMGGVVTIRKAHANPDSETLSFWILSAASAVFAMLAVGAWAPMMLAYPAYILALNLAVMVAIHLGRVRGGPMTLDELRRVGADLDLAHKSRTSVSQM